jgi:hypothetical protein
MLGPLLVSSVFVLAVVALCLVKPHIGRIFMGIFFLAMALGVNGSFTFSNPKAYVDYAQGALIPLYRDLAVSVITISPVIFGLLLMAFEITVGLLILYKQKFVKIGLIGTILFLIGIAPLSWLQIPWLGLIIGNVYLLTKEFETTFWDSLKAKLFSFQH